jgi:hypothetical protein
MADSDKVLIICRDLKSARKLQCFKSGSQCRYILASDDPRVHKAAKSYPWIDEICWIEQMESFYNVAADVICLTETVNKWLKTLADNKHGFAEELLFFTRHVEGGMTTQRIQDLLLLIRSYHFMLDTYKITSIIVISQPGMGWEDDVLIETARTRGVDIQLIGYYSFAVLIKNAWSFLKVYARSAYHTVNVVRINSRNRFRSEKVEAADREIVFQLCSSAYKHVENIVPLMKALNHKGYNPVALCWHSNERYTKESGADQVRREGLRAEALEKFCSFSDIWNSISGIFWTWEKAKGKKREFLSHHMLNYRLVPLGSLLWPSIRFFIIAELAQSYKLGQALGKYFKKHAPLAIRLWGETELREGFLAWKSLDAQQLPLIFSYGVGAYINWPYEKPDCPVNLLFVAGKYHKRMVLKSNIIPSDSIEICGQARYEGIDDFKKKYNAERSRIELKMPHRFTMHVFLDAGCIIRGFLSTQEQVTITSFLLKFASEQASVALIIKPHPGHKVGILESLIDTYALKNVFLIDKNMLPYHALNTADMLITKFSTLGIEAMLFGCPVICCVLDSEKRFNIYEGAADYLYQVDNLEDLLLKLVSDNGFRQEWHERHIRKQKNFLAEYFREMEEPPSVCQAMVLDKYLKEG